MIKIKNIKFIKLILITFLMSPYADANEPPKDQQTCLRVGGKWEPVCMKQSFACLKQYKDAAKSCTDGSQCEGKKCLNTGNNPNDIGVISGQCVKDDNPCGASMLIENGAVVVGIIAD